MTSTLGLLITLACFSTIFGHREEPINSCTRIDFEEKMLMKMVTLQVTVEMTLSSINAKLEEFSTEKAKLMKDIETFKVDLKEELGAFKVGQKEEVGAFKVAADDVMKQQTTQQEQFIKEMSSKYDTMVSQTNGVVQRIQADVQNATQELQVATDEAMKLHTTQQEQFIKEMSSKYDTMVSKTDGMVQRIQADVQNATHKLQVDLGGFKVTTDDVMKQQTTQQEQFIKEMSSKYDTMVSQTDGMVQRIQADVKNATQELQVDLGGFKVTTDDVMKQQTKQQEQFIKEMSSKYDTMVSQTDGMVQRIQADVKNATQELQVDLKEELGTFKIAADDVMKQQTTQQEQFIKEMSSKYDTMVSQSYGMVHQMQTDVIVNVTKALQVAADDVMTQQTTQQEQFIKEMSSKYDTMMSQPYMVQRIQADVTQELKKRIVQDPVAFIARFSGNVQPVPSATLIFNTVVQNIGDGYDTADGTFTAPVTGAYVLSAQVCIETGKYITFHIRSKDTLYSVSRHGEKDFDTMCSSVSTVAVLTAGEKVWVLCSSISSGGWLYSDSVNHWTMFSGALVQPAV